MNYDDLFCWRNICEFLASVGGFAHPEKISLKYPGCDRLISYDRTHRQELWDTYKIQLIIWEKHSRRVQGWSLKGNWEFKIDFLSSGLFVR